MFYIVLLILSVFRCTVCWNADTHELIARIASKQLRHRSLTRIARLFPRYDSAQTALVEIAAWADSQEESDPYHFTHTPYRKCAPFHRTRDCENDKCLVTGIEKYWMQFVDLATSDSDRATALKYIVHFIADATQPLHTGFKEDAGGNGIVIPDGKSLHEYWDWVLLDNYKTKKRMNKDELFESLIDGLGWSKISQLNIPPEIMLGSPYDIAAFLVTETSTRYTCNIAYSRAKDDYIESGQDLGDKYIASRQVAILQQITKAGIRLGQIIDKMIDEYVQALKLAERERPRAVAAANPPAPQACAADLSSNIYNILFEFDPDEFFKEETPLVLPPTPKKAAGKKSKKSTVATDDLNEDEFLDQAIAEKNARLFEGVDLSEVIAIKQGGLYYITRKAVKRSQLFRGSFFTLNVRLPNVENPVTFLLDTSLKEDGSPPSPELIDALLRTISGKEIVGMLSSAEQAPPLKRRDRLVDLLREQLSDTMLVQIGLADPSRTSVLEIRDTTLEVAKQRLNSQLSKLVLLPFEGLSFISRKDWLMKPFGGAVHKITVVAHDYLNMENPTESRYMLVDTRVFDQPIDLDTFHKLNRLSNRMKSNQDLMEIMQANQKLGEIFGELSEVVLGRFPPNKPFTAIKTITSLNPEMGEEYIEIVFA